jgi:hypothetical protein
MIIITAGLFVVVIVVMTKSIFPLFTTSTVMISISGRPSSLSWSNSVFVISRSRPGSGFVVMIRRCFVVAALRLSR